MSGGRRAAERGQRVASPRRGCIAADRGSASVLVALWVVVLTTLAGAVLVLTSVLAARTSLASATDLAALAGAAATVVDPQRSLRSGSVDRAGEQRPPHALQGRRG